MTNLNDEDDGGTGYVQCTWFAGKICYNLLLLVTNWNTDETTRIMMIFNVDWDLLENGKYWSCPAA